MQEIDRAFIEWLFLGVRQMRRYLVSLGYGVGKKRVHRLMRLMGLMAVYQKQKTSVPNPDLPAARSDHRQEQSGLVRGHHIRPMRKGFLYLVAMMDWHSRKMLSWRLSNTMDVDFCVSTLEEALAKYGSPDIFNTDQGSQFTSFAFTSVLRDKGIRISMDGRGRWLDNVSIENLWRSLKYENVYLNAYATGSEARAGIGKWIALQPDPAPQQLEGITPEHYYHEALLKAA